MSAAAGTLPGGAHRPAPPKASHTAAHTPDDPNQVGHGAAQAGDGSEWPGPAPRRIVVGYGFWLFLLSDFILFAAFFAAYAVLSGATAGGPGPHQLFDLDTVAVETACLLLSSFSCGLATIAASRRRVLWTQLALLATGLLGAAFVLLELREFADLVARGAGPQRSAFLSAFFTLVGCHGLHVTVGLLWLGTMMAQIQTRGFRPEIERRLMCFGLFWHALDIVWVALFTVVYLLGAL